jgi:enoyl-CoA hydratase
MKTAHSEARMDELVSYRTEGPIATISLDDGKRNALSVAMLDAIGAALDRAEAERASVVLSGRVDVFSAGFDLTALRGNPADARTMFMKGFRLARRLLAFPFPVTVACTGHAIAMGAFLLLSADYRVGAEGAYKFIANEVALGLTLPASAVEICRQRLAPAHFQRVTILSELYAPDGAIAAGFLDRVVPVNQVGAVAHELASGFAKLNMHAHAATKLRVRAQALAALDAALEADEAYFRTLG